MWHRLLQRQINKFVEPELIETYEQKYSGFFKAVNDTYNHFDEDRQLLLRSLDISSKEFAELNKKLRSENEIVEQKVQDRTRELSFEQEKLIQIAEHMTTGAILLDSKGAVTFINKTASDLLRDANPETCIESLVKFFSETPVREHIQKSLTCSTVEISEIEANGGIYSISFDSLSAQSEMFGTLIWIRNITAPKLLERSKNQFLAIASHEMRTPLAIIRGNSELLLTDPYTENNPDVKEQVESILKSSVRLLGIVNDFLDVQHLESGKVSLKLEDIDVAQVIQDTTEDLRKIADEKNLFIRVDIVQNLQKIKLDKYRLQQICINIISNAIHYTNQGGITISSKVFPNKVEILFQDTGVGMNEEDKAKLFQKFQTGKTFLRSREYGSGLGLYISGMLARFMGLELSLESSTPGVGTIFKLSLPFEPVALDTAPLT